MVHWHVRAKVSEPLLCGASPVLRWAKGSWLAELFGGVGDAGQLHTASLISWCYFWPGEWWSGVRMQSAEMGAFRNIRLCGYDFCRPPVRPGLVPGSGGGWLVRRQETVVHELCGHRKPLLHFLSWKWRKQNRCYRRIDSSFSVWSFSSSWPTWTSSWWLSIRPSQQGMKTHGLRQSGNYLRPRSTSTIRLSGRLRWCRDISEVNLQNPPHCYLQRTSWRCGFLTWRCPNYSFALCLGDGEERRWGVQHSEPKVLPWRPL